MDVVPDSVDHYDHLQTHHGLNLDAGASQAPPGQHHIFSEGHLSSEHAQIEHDHETWNEAATPHIHTRDVHRQADERLAQTEQRVHQLFSDRRGESTSYPRIAEGHNGERHIIRSAAEEPHPEDEREPEDESTGLFGGHDTWGESHGER